MISFSFIVSLLLKGIAMGAANVIPGVSGGTIAFITGIYERLINSLKSFDLKALQLLFSFRIAEFIRYTDLYFLTFLFLGVGISILSLARVLEWAFLNHEIPTLAFFFGLIVASVYGVGKEIGSKNTPVIISIVIGVSVAVLMAFLTPATSNDNVFYIFLCGIVAVCSMILPGLSGSYILLLMGNYVLVLQAINTLDFALLIPLLIGCVAGLVMFSRLLSFLFSKYRGQTIGLLTGFVLGSLLIIWPWKQTEYLIVEAGKEKAVGYTWYLPELNAEFLIAFTLMLAGFFIVFFIERLGGEKTSK